MTKNRGDGLALAASQASPARITVRLSSLRTARDAESGRSFGHAGTGDARGWQRPLGRSGGNELRRNGRLHAHHGWSGLLLGKQPSRGPARGLLARIPHSPLGSLGS